MQKNAPDNFLKTIVFSLLVSTSVSAAELPAFFSWGDFDGRNCMTPIAGDQGTCSACAVFSTCGAFEARLKYYLNRDVDISEQYIISCWDEDPYFCGSPNIGTMLNFMETEGIPEETCFPWQSYDGNVRPCGDACEHVNFWRYSADTSQIIYGYVSGGEWVPPVTIDEMKQLIMDHGPTVPQLMLDETQFRNYTGGVYTENKQSRWGHLVVFYGWDDSDSCWLAKNSFGTSWGEAGPLGDEGPVTTEKGWFRIEYKIINENSMSVHWVEPKWNNIAPPAIISPPDSTFDLAPDCPHLLVWSCPDEMAYCELVIYDSSSLLIDDIIYDSVFLMNDYAIGGIYHWQVRYHDNGYGISLWSDISYFGISPDAECCDLRGDANGDQNLNILDVSCLVGYIYRNGLSPKCCAEADANADDAINIIDITAIIGYLYRNCTDCIVPCP